MMDQHGVLETPLRKKILVIGDMSGKSATIQVYIQDEFCHTYATIFDNFQADVEVDGTYVVAEIIDTTCSDKFGVIRKEMYANADVVIIFFSVYSRQSFRNVQEIWLPEVMKSRGRIPFILVGTIAMIGHSDGDKVSFEEAQALADEIGALCYVECWPDRKYNVDRVFQEAISATLKGNGNKA